MVLHQKGYRIGYTTVCNYISGKERRSSEAFIRQRYKPGSVCEFDWGEVKIHIQGKRTVLQMAVFTSGYSNYRYACLFYRQDTLAFMESHVKFFAHTGGVYHQMVYDNMRVAVARFVGRNEKEPTQALTNLKGHYQFHHRFCNTYRGNEKGHVERSVEYIRRKAFGFRDGFSSLDQAQEYLSKVVEKLNRTPRQQSGKTSQDLFNQEQQALWDVPMPFSCYSTEQLRVDKYATVSYCYNRYSVPDNLVGEFVDVKIFSDQLKLYYQDHHIATHERSYGPHTWTINLDHYLDTLHKKPGALGNSEGLAQSPGQLRALYSQYYQQSPRDFIELLLYCRKHRISKERLYDAEQTLLRICPMDINTEKLIALLGNTTSPMPAAVHGHDEKIQQASIAHLLALTNLVEN
jgi:transposase